MIDDQDQTLVEFSEDVATQAAPVPLPVREYRGSIKSAARHLSQNSGKASVALGVFVDPAEYPADYIEGNPDGTVLTTWRPSLEDTPAGRYSVRRFCEKVGLPVPSRSLDLTVWVGHEVKVRVKHNRDNNGDMRAEIAEITGV